MTVDAVTKSLESFKQFPLLFGQTAIQRLDRLATHRWRDDILS